MKIFIVPYRNRKYEFFVFINQMKYLLEDVDDYRIYIIEQDDKREFNRGAMRNIGFLMAKKEYPNTYKEIDFIFHDLDNVIGEKNMVKFETKDNEVNHIFGSYRRKNIGGIFVMKGGNYEKINGFPNFWGWGFEDDILYNRIKKNNMKIVRDNFSYFDKRVVKLNRSQNGTAFSLSYFPRNRSIASHCKKTGQILKDGLNTLKNIKFTKSEKMYPFVINWKIQHFDCNIPLDMNKEEKWIMHPLICRKMISLIKKHDKRFLLQLFSRPGGLRWGL